MAACGSSTKQSTTSPITCLALAPTPIPGPTTSKMIAARTTFGLGLLLLALSAGCSGDQPITVPVSGHITFAGGPCPAEGTIVFSPVAVEKGLPRRPGTARFQSDGAFTVT